MMRFLALIVLLTFAVALPLESQAGETADLLKEAMELLQAGNLAEAREVTAIALDQMDYELLDTTAATFPLTVGTFTRGEVETQKAMGMDITSCVYRDADGNEIEVQMMGGVAVFLEISRVLGRPLAVAEKFGFRVAPAPFSMITVTRP